MKLKKTKTSFDLNLDKSTPFRTTFDISNVGSKDASAVSVRIVNKNDFDIVGNDAILIGNMKQGDFTTISYNIMPKSDVALIKLEISYNDIAGVRNSINKTILLDKKDYEIKETGVVSQDMSKNQLYYILGGVLLGVIVGFILFRKGKTESLDKEKEASEFKVNSKKQVGDYR